MNDQLRTRLGAVTLALLTLAAIIFAGLNFQQRSRFVLPDDGVIWMDSPQGVVAWHVVSGSPADRAGIKQGDTVESVRGVAIHRATDVTKVLYHAARGPSCATASCATAHRSNCRWSPFPRKIPPRLENYLRVTALLYLFIGLFIFVRRWNAPRAVHFYIFCLASFVLYSFHYSGKLNSFDWTIYWGNVVALLLQPALAGAFCAGVSRTSRHALAEARCGLQHPGGSARSSHICRHRNARLSAVASAAASFSTRSNSSTWACYFLAAAGIFLASYFRAPSGVLRQQLKWVTGGTFAGFCHSSCCLHLAVPLGNRAAAAVDEAVRLFFGADSALLRLCHHPLPADGRGHHFQARPGLYVCHGRRRRHLLRGDRGDRRTLSHGLASRARRAL